MNKKNESDLDEELNEHLDFLEEDDHHTSKSSDGTEYLPPSPSLLNDANKKSFIIIIGVIITIVSIGLMIRNKNHKASVIKPLPTINNQNATNNDGQSNQIEQLATSNNNLNWQELKKSAGDAVPEQPMQPADAAISSNNANTFEINLPIGHLDNAAAQIKTIQPNVNNYNAQENINELKAVIEHITQELANNVNQIKELQHNLQEISSSISNVNHSVNGIDSRIVNLASTVDTLSMDVKNVKKYMQEEDLDLTANVKPSEPDLFSNTPEYVVHAVIPGRAWLKSSSGQIITVAEGDSLGDYGKIALIDAANNLVRTSSGVVFR